MRVVEYLTMAADMYRRVGEVTPAEAKRLIGGPFHIDHIVSITGVSEYKLAEAYMDNERPGGRLTPESLRDLAQLRHLVDIGAGLDRHLVWRVIQNGTSDKIVARLLRTRPREILKILEEGVVDEAGNQIQ